MRIILSVLLVLGLAGCATTRGGHDAAGTDELRNKISTLETELQEKNQTISDLERELSNTQDAAFLSGSAKESHKGRLSHKEIQQALAKAGYYTGDIDGKIGPATKRAIKAFQEANGLRADGVVGKKTSKKLKNYLD